ncbi:MAG TPA: hypothetical protein G4N92_02080 [Anaerolineae bacterium]|nr:hypothetical protein [Anaerolineae bacterium]
MAGAIEGGPPMWVAHFWGVSARLPAVAPTGLPAVASPHPFSIKPGEEVGKLWMIVKFRLKFWSTPTNPDNKHIF